MGFCSGYVSFELAGSLWSHGGSFCCCWLLEKVGLVGVWLFVGKRTVVVAGKEGKRTDV